MLSLKHKRLSTWTRLGIWFILEPCTTKMYNKPKLLWNPTRIVQHWSMLQHQSREDTVCFNVHNVHSNIFFESQILYAKIDKKSRRFCWILLPLLYSLFRSSRDFSISGATQMDFNSKKHVKVFGRRMLKLSVQYFKLLKREKSFFNIALLVQTEPIIPVIGMLYLLKAVRSPISQNTFVSFTSMLRSVSGVRWCSSKTSSSSGASAFAITTSKLASMSFTSWDVASGMTTFSAELNASSTIQNLTTFSSWPSSKGKWNIDSLYKLISLSKEIQYERQIQATVV